jgi:MFS family permease
MIEDEKDRKISRLSIVETVVVILSITFFIRASNNMLQTSIPLLVRYDFNFTQTDVGIIAALSSAMTFITTALLNARLNSRSRRRAFILSNVIYTVVFIGFWGANYISIWVLAAIAGAVFGLMIPNLVTAAGLFKDTAVRERALSLYTLSLSLSLVAGPAVESYLLKFYPLRTVFILFVSFAASSTLLSPLIRFPEESRKMQKGNVLRNYGFRSAILNIVAYNVPFSMIVAFAGIYEKETFDISLSLVTLLFSFFFLSSFLSRLFLSIKPPRNIKLLMIVAMVMSTAGILLMVISTNISTFIVALVILGIPHGLTYPLSVLSIARSFDPGSRNVANSYFFSIMMAIGILLPLIGGPLIEFYGFKLTFGLILLFIVLVMLMLSLNFLAEKKMKDNSALVKTG